jgi:dsRNA-specific ribonuclease
MSRFPQALSQGHQRIREVLKQQRETVRDWIEGIFRRIPDDFVARPPVKLLPIDVTHVLPFPRIFGASVHLLNHLLGQIRPLAVGQPLPSELTRDCAAFLAHEIGYEFSDLALLRSALTDPSYPFKEMHCIPVDERLAFLGDAVLDVCTLFPLFNANCSALEEEMTMVKQILVSNDLFASLCVAIGLNKYVIARSLAAYTTRGKPLADVMEALFGAIFLDSSLTSCCRVHQFLVRRHRQLFYQAVARFPPGRAVIDHIIGAPPEEFGRLTRWLLPRFGHPATVESVQEMLGFPIALNDLQWFQLALTHPGAGAGVNYQRLEFIGDAIVKLTITLSLFCAFPGAESGMSIVAADYRSNARLGAAAIRLGLGAAAIPPPDRPEMIAKYQGDLFEAVVAAIAMTKGLHRAVEFIQKHVIGDTFDNRADDPRSDSKSALLTKCAQLFKGYVVSFQTWLDGPEVLSSVVIGKVQLPFLGRGERRSDAEKAVARVLLAEFEKPEFVADLIQKVGDGVSPEGTASSIHDAM